MNYIDQERYIRFDRDTLLELATILADTEAGWIRQADRVIHLPWDVVTYRTMLDMLGDMTLEIIAQLEADCDEQLAAALLERQRLLAAVAINVRYHMMLCGQLKPRQNRVSEARSQRAH